MDLWNNHGICNWAFSSWTVSSPTKFRLLETFIMRILSPRSMTYRFAVCFLASDSKLSDSQVECVISRAGSLYFQGQQEGNVTLLNADQDSLEGKITGGQWV